VTLLDLATGRPIGRVLESQLKIDVNDSSIRNLALAPDGSTLAVWGEDGVALWSLAGRQLLARAFPRRGAAFAFANAEGSRLIASPFFGSPPVAWNMAVDPPARIPFIDKPAVAAFLDNGKVLITNPTHGEARGEEPIRLWDPVTLTPVSALPRAEIAFGMAAHRKAGLLAVGQTPSVKVFDLESGRLVAELDDLDRFQRVEWVPNLSFSPDGRWLVGTSDRGHALVWDTSTWQAVEKPLSTREGEAMFAAYSPDGRYLLTADGIGLLTLRDPESYEPVGDPLVGHRGALVSQGAFFSRDGRRLLTNGPDGTRLWDVESRAEIGDTFPADPRDPGAGTPDADAITALGKHLLLWDTETDRWFDIACRAAGRNMTPAEWEEFGPTDERHRATCEQWPVPG
jgi:WD40 repeat protein